jgi:hypothetical protein
MMIGMGIQCCKETGECIKRDCPTYQEMVDHPLMLDESDPDERQAIRGVVSSGRAVLDGMAGAPRIREDDERLRKARLAALELQGVVEGARMSSVEELLMLVRYLPGSFISSYLRLIDAAIGEKNLGSGSGAGEEGNGKEYGTRSGIQTKSEISGYRGGAKHSGKPSSGMGMPLKSEERMMDLDRYRKRLRGMAREIVMLLRDNGGGESRPILRRRCDGKCRRLGDADFLYCPNCGGPMTDVVK